MFVKLALFACLVVAATAQKWNGPLAGGVPASQFPAGISPQACPNFPVCNNPAVAANPSAPAPGGGWNGGNQGGGWNGGNQGGGWNGGNQGGGWDGSNSLSPLDRGDYVGDGDYRGEGLAESGAYGNQGGWNGGNNGGWNGGNNGQWNNGGGWNGGNNGGGWGGNTNNPGGWAAAPGAAAAIPAGVDPHSCPNYPFCH